MTILEDFDVIASNTDAKFAMMAMANKHVDMVATRLSKRPKKDGGEYFNIDITRYEWSNEVEKYVPVKQDRPSYISIKLPEFNKYTIYGKISDKGNFVKEDIAQLIHREIESLTNRWNTEGDPVAVASVYFRRKSIEYWSNRESYGSIGR